MSFCNISGFSKVKRMPEFLHSIALLGEHDYFCFFEKSSKYQRTSCKTKGNNFCNKAHVASGNQLLTYCSDGHTPPMYFTFKASATINPSIRSLRLLVEFQNNDQRSWADLFIKVINFSVMNISQLSTSYFHAADWEHFENTKKIIMIEMINSSTNITHHKINFGLTTRLIEKSMEYRLIQDIRSRRINDIRKRIGDTSGIFYPQLIHNIDKNYAHMQLKVQFHFSITEPIYFFFHQGTITEMIFTNKQTLNLFTISDFYNKIIQTKCEIMNFNFKFSYCLNIT